MFVKLNDNLINLDLVREISEVFAILQEHPNYYQVLNDKETVKWLELTTVGNESQKQYSVLFCFNIHYLNEQYPKIIKVSTTRNEAVKAREALATLLNGNQPVIHEIKY